MSEGPIPSTDGDFASQAESPTAERLSEVLRLTTLLSDQVLDAHIIKRPVPDGQARALEKAAFLPQEHDVPLPPPLMQVLHEVEGDDHGEKAAAEPSRPNRGLDYTRAVKSLARLFKPARRP